MDVECRRVQPNGIFGEGAMGSKHLVETGNSISGSEVRDGGADGVDYA